MIVTMEFVKLSNLHQTNLAEQSVIAPKHGHLPANQESVFHSVAMAFHILLNNSDFSQFKWKNLTPDLKPTTPLG